MKNSTPEVLVGAPKGAQCFISGQYLKIGRHNKIFAHRNGEWVLTNGITVEKIQRELMRLEL